MKKAVRLFLLVSVVAFLNFPLHSQSIKAHDYLIEQGFMASEGDHTPFWLMSNQNSMFSDNNVNMYSRFGIKTKAAVEKKYDYGYGLDVVARSIGDANLYLNEAYFELKISFLNFQFGSKTEKFGEQDSSLSSGGLLWSGNSRPLPKVSVSIPQYVPVPFTNNKLEIKGGISHAWFGDNFMVENSWMHHKYGYFKFGGESKFNIYAGFHHFVQWGGKSEDPEIGLLPDTFNDFVRVLLAKQGDIQANPVEQANTLGNHLGWRDIGINLDLQRSKINVYWQSMLEDSSGMAWRNIRDGLWGISFHTYKKKKVVNGILYEFINTKDQSGSWLYYWLLDGVKYNYNVDGSTFHYAGGNDDYFNNVIYRYGWTYKDMTIGTPFITSPSVLKGDRSEADYLRNNKITGHHFGLEGEYRYFFYKMFFTYYLNYGTNLYPFENKLPQYSVYLNVRMAEKLPWGLIAELATGYDHGRFYGNNIGLLLKVSKNGILSGRIKSNALN